MSWVYRTDHGRVRLYEAAHEIIEGIPLQDRLYEFFMSTRDCRDPCMWDISKGQHPKFAIDGASQSHLCRTYHSLQQPQNKYPILLAVLKGW